MVLGTGMQKECLHGIPMDLRGPSMHHHHSAILQDRQEREIGVWTQTTYLSVLPGAMHTDGQGRHFQ
jgi:hypothetical protein